MQEAKTDISLVQITYNIIMGSHSMHAIATFSFQAYLSLAQTMSGQGGGTWGWRKYSLKILVALGRRYENTGNMTLHLLVPSVLHQFFPRVNWMLPSSGKVHELLAPSFVSHITLGFVGITKQLWHQLEQIRPTEELLFYKLRP